MERRLAAVLVADMVGFSRLMENNEPDIINKQKNHRRELIDLEIERHRGSIIKTTGDGLLAEFGSVQDAVRSAIEIQNGMLHRERNFADNEKIEYRFGINVGDFTEDSGDIFGDSVNIAARLEALSVPGGLCVSDIVYQIIQDKITEPFKDLGFQRVKNLSRPIRVWQWERGKDNDREVSKSDKNPIQHIKFCIASDDTQIAYARAGGGLPILKAPNWLGHIEYEWRSPIWGPWLSALSVTNELIRFDQRGGGLSDWEVEDISENKMITDMESVVKAANLDKFALLGISQGCAFSIRYAYENPDHVSCLVLFGGYTHGRLLWKSSDSESLHKSGLTGIEEGCGASNPSYRHFFTSGFIPDATKDQANSFDELQRVSTNKENAARIHVMNGAVDVSELAKKLNKPCLVLHFEGDRVTPLEEGRRMAALIPGARFVPLKGNNHAILEETPAFDEFITEIANFVAEHG